MKLFFSIGFLFICNLLVDVRRPVMAQEFHSSTIDDAFQQIGQKKEWIPAGLEVFEGPEAFEVEQNNSDYLVEYEVQKIFRGSFYTAKDSLWLVAKLFVFPTQIKAFGFYSIDKTPSLNFLQIGYESFTYQKNLVSWYNNYVLHLEVTDTLKKSEKALKDFAQEFINFLPRKKKYTPILDCFPSKHRVRHSEKFYGQRWLDQDYFKNIYYADYYTPDGYSRIFIIDNLHTENADSNFWKFKRYMSSYSAVINDTLQVQTDYFVVNDPLWGLVILAKKNKIIYGILDYRNKKWAEERLAELLSELKKRNIVMPG